MSEVLKAAETLIQENDALLGVANVDHVNSKYEHYLNMTEDDLDELDKKDCIAIQYILTQYAISINKRLNWLNSRLAINKSIYHRALAEVWASYGESFMSNDLRAASADNEYPYIKEMHDEILKLKAVIDSMDGLVERVDSLVKIIKGLEFTKGRG